MMDPKTNLPGERETQPELESHDAAPHKHTFRLAYRNVKTGREVSACDCGEKLDTSADRYNADGSPKGGDGAA